MAIDLCLDVFRGGCVVLYVGSRNFAVEARRVERVFTDAGANATGTIDGLTAAIVSADYLLQPYNSSSFGGISLGSFNSTSETLSRESQNINHIIHKNTRILDKVVIAL
jgi:hypothetical protein